MTSRTRTASCAFCESEQTFRRPSFPHAWHLALCIATLGLWLISYFVFWWYWNRAHGWRCRSCGHRFRLNGLRTGPTGVPPSACSPASQAALRELASV
jgi:hypothetical protein